MESDQIFGLLLGLVVLGVYIGLIIVGVHLAKLKNRSPHWMWFAVHPIGLIVVLIVMACLSPLKECPQCVQKMKSHARLCAFCGYRFADMGTMAVPRAGYDVTP